MEYGAVMQLGSVWLGTKIYLFTGDSPSEVIREMEQRIDIPYMLVQSGDFETEKRHLLPLLQAFYDKYTAGEITMEDIAALDFDLKAGQICCLAVAEGKAATAALAENYPHAITIR